MKKKKVDEKALTLKVLTNYNRGVLLPALEKRIVSKKDFGILNIEFKFLNKDFKVLKNNFESFKDGSLTNQDKMLKKLDILLTEKTVREYQEGKEKELWAIIIKSLREHQILSPHELDQIAHLEIF